MSNKIVKSERFKKVASSRVQKILNSLDSLSKCSNQNNYEYSKEDVDKMLNVLKTKFKYVENSFRQNLEKGKSNFEF